MNKKLLAGLLATALLAGQPALAADTVKVGFLSTLSGPAAGLGVDIRDGFQLAMKHLGGKLGGVPTEVIIADDQQNPNTAKQATERFLKKDKVDFMTGIVFSNILLTVTKSVFDSQTFYISSNAGPSQLAGADCNPYFFNVSWQNDNVAEAMGKWATDQGYKNVVGVAPNYPAGKDALNGFKRFFKGSMSDEVYTKLGQLDYAAELAQLRAAKPDAVFFFLPGGMGINFIKQYIGGGLKEIPLVAPGFSADQDVIQAVGEPMLGLYNTAHWTHDLPLPANTAFVSAFRKKYDGRYPTVYAAMAYDAIMAMDAAVRDVGGKLDDRAAVAKALAKPSFKSVRGEFSYGANNYPVQNYYLRVVEKDAEGKLTNKLVGTVMEKHQDAYVGECAL